MRLHSMKEYASAGAAGSRRRWASEFAHEEWAMDPLDRMTATEFEAMLVTKFGAEYLEPVDYERLGDGCFVPVHTPARKIRSLFRRHPNGLTRLEIKRLSGLSHGQIADIVCPPAYTIIDHRGAGRTRSQVWAPTQGAAIS